MCHQKKGSNKKISLSALQIGQIWSEKHVKIAFLSSLSSWHPELERINAESLAEQINAESLAEY